MRHSWIEKKINKTVTSHWNMIGMKTGMWSQVNSALLDETYLGVRLNHRTYELTAKMSVHNQAKRHARKMSKFLVELQRLID